MHKLVGRINGRFGTLEHAPIHYLDKTVDFCELCASMVKVAGLVGHGWPPPAPLIGSEGLGLLYALRRRGLAP